MPRYRHALPQLSGPTVFLTDGGLETTLIFHDGIDLPDFAAFPLLEDEAGGASSRRTSILISDRRQEPAPASCSTRRPGAPTPTGGAARLFAPRRWRRSTARPSSWRRIRATPGDAGDAASSTACLGPSGDGYLAGAPMSRREARAYHAARSRPSPTAGRHGHRHDA